MNDTGEKRGGALSPIEKMEITLRFLGDPGFQEGIAYDSGLHQSTVSKNVFYTLTSISQTLNNWIKWPDTALEKSQVNNIVYLLE